MPELKPQSETVEPKAEEKKQETPTETATPSTAKKSSAKKSSTSKGKKNVKTATKKKPAKKAPKSKKESTPRGPTIRERVFKLIANKPHSGAQIMEKLELGGVPALLKDEGISPKPRIKRVVEEGVRGVLYTLTALGKKDLAEGKVDENAAEKAAGKEWPANR